MTTNLPTLFLSKVRRVITNYLEILANVIFIWGLEKGLKMQLGLLFQLLPCSTYLSIRIFDLLERIYHPPLLCIFIFFVLLCSALLFNLHDSSSIYNSLCFMDSKVIYSLNQRIHLKNYYNKQPLYAPQCQQIMLASPFSSC